MELSLTEIERLGAEWQQMAGQGEYSEFQSGYITCPNTTSLENATNEPQMRRTENWDWVY